MIPALLHEQIAFSKLKMAIPVNAQEGDHLPSDQAQDIFYWLDTIMLIVLTCITVFIHMPYLRSTTRIEN